MTDEKELSVPEMVDKMFQHSRHMVPPSANDWHQYIADVHNELKRGTLDDEVGLMRKGYKSKVSPRDMARTLNDEYPLRHKAPVAPEGGTET